ncbi:MAG: choice-of-anchor B family protein [Planctomycetota bacterium]|jgi:choice-of-anchor B domain-containing protein
MVYYPIDNRTLVSQHGVCGFRPLPAGAILLLHLAIGAMASVADVALAGTGGFPSENVTLLSHVDLEDFPGQPERANDCWGYVSPSGREYALVGLFHALAVVEVTNPSAPVVIAEIDHQESNWSDIKVYQDHAYVVNEEGGGMDVVDLSQVDNGVVTLVQRFTESSLNTAHNVAVDTTSGFLYLCGANLNSGGLIAIDVSTPAAPFLAGAVMGAEGAYVHDAQIVTYTKGPNSGKQIAFCANGGTGLDIYDVTDKGNMFRLSRSTYPNLSYAHQCWTEDFQYLYLNDELDAVNETVIFDILDLSSPSVVGTFSSGVEAIDHNLYIHQGIIYEAEYTAGLRVFDASDPVNPVPLGWLDTYPPSDAAATIGAWGTYPFLPSGNVLISTKDAGLFVVRIGEPPLQFAFPDGTPDQVLPTGDSFAVQITGIDGEEIDPSTATLHVNTGSGFVPLAMTSHGGGSFTAVFDPIDCAETAQYYVSCTTLTGITINNPLSAPIPSYEAVVGMDVTTVLYDEMETDAGWTTGVPGDSASHGIWTRVDPRGNGAQPENDHTPDPGAMCYVTGQEPENSNDGDNDVDGGTTTLLSPVFDLSGASDATISYWRWYDNDFSQIDADEGNGPNEDVFTIDISGTGGLSWENVETIGPTGPETSGGWILHSFNVADYVTPSTSVRIRFVASDFGSLSVVEAGVDDFRISIVQCAGSGDVPAASSWGLAVFTTMLLVSGTLLFRRLGWSSAWC